MDFFKQQFDKLVLIALVLFMVFAVFHASHDQTDRELVNWAREIAGTLLGGLLGLITGKISAQRDQGTNGSPK